MYEHNVKIKKMYVVHLTTHNQCVSFINISVSMYLTTES